MLLDTFAQSHTNPPLRGGLSPPLPAKGKGLGIGIKLQKLNITIMKTTRLFILLLLQVPCWVFAQNVPKALAPEKAEGAFYGVSKSFSFDTTIREEDIQEGSYDNFAKGGKFYALLIGVQDYKDTRIKALGRPVIDAQNLYDILSERYVFEKSNMSFLKNPTRSEITKSLDSLSKKVTPKDNVLIFYAGHGFWDGGMETGYWFPKEALSDDKSTWFSNNELFAYLRNIRSKHTLLITDACFSGGVFKSNRDAFDDADVSITRQYDTPSRRAMTSGALTTVPDESAFINFLTKQLRQNDDVFLTASDLFFAIKNPIIRASEKGVLPQFGELNLDAHQGGDFIFVLRRPKKKDKE
jgi:hypothetical protein